MESAQTNGQIATSSSFIYFMYLKMKYIRLNTFAFLWGLSILRTQCKNLTVEDKCCYDYT